MTSVKALWGPGLVGVRSGRSPQKLEGRDGSRDICIEGGAGLMGMEEPVECVYKEKPPQFK
jgi:hypothetical protein